MNSQRLTITTVDGPRIYKWGNTLVDLAGFDVSLSFSDGNRGADECFVKVFNPEEQRDCDGDWQAWRFRLAVAKREIITSAIYVLGYAEEDDLSFYTCKHGHQAWEHDGNCGDGEMAYQGWVELVYGFRGEPAEPKFEFGEDWTKWDQPW